MEWPSLKNNYPTGLHISPLFHSGLVLVIFNMASSSESSFNSENAEADDEEGSEFQFYISGEEKKKRSRDSLSINGVPQNWQSTCNLYKKYLTSPWGSKFPPTMTVREQNALRNRCKKIEYEAETDELFNTVKHSSKYTSSSFPLTFETFATMEMPAWLVEIFFQIMETQK